MSKPRYRIRANGRPEFLTQDGFVPSSHSFSSGASIPFAAPSSTVGQHTTPDMRSPGLSNSSGTCVNTRLATNTMVSAGEYREHGRSVSGLRASPSSWSGSTGRMSQDERPVFIVSDEFASAFPRPILKDTQPHTLAGRGHEPHRPPFPKANHDLSLSHESTSATLRFAEVRNVHAE